MPTLNARDLRPHQREIGRLAFEALRDDKRLFIYGGKGTLKTSTLVTVLWTQLRTLDRFYRDIRILVAAMTHKQIKDAFLAAWQEQIDPGEYDYNQGTGEIRLITGNRAAPVIQLAHTGDAKEGASADRAARAKRGGNINGYYFPQAESLAHSFYNEIESRVRHVPTPRPGVRMRPPFRIRYLDANPDSPAHWLHGMFLDPDATTYQGPAKAIVRGYATTPETSAYSADQIAFFRQTWPTHEISRMLDGLWVGAQGAMFHLDARHIRTDLPTSPRWYLAFDWGRVADQAVLLIAIGDDCVHVAAEWVAADLDQEEHIPHVRDMIRRAGEPEISAIACDTAEPRKIQYWRSELSTRVLSVRKDRSAGWEAMIRRTKTIVGGRPMLSVDPACVKTIRSLRDLAWDARTEDALEGAYDHPADALRYIVMSSALPDHKRF